MGRAHGLSRVTFAVATGPAMVGFLLGASPDRGTSRRLWGLLALTFLPLVGLLGALLLARGRVGLGAVVLSATIVLFLVLDAIWAYPLYRLGRSVSVESQ